MSLLFTSTYDQALLAKVIGEAQSVVQKRNGFVGRTSVQKLMYFLKILDVPMGYTFRLHHFGPFSPEIMTDVDFLVADDVIVDEAPKEDYSNYKPSGNFDELTEKYQEKIDPHNDKITDVVEVFAPLHPEQLELLTTIDFLYRSKKATGHQGPFRKFVLKELERVKKEKFDQGKFSDDKASEYYDSMAKIKLIEP